jgi:hypothetical protein
VFTTSVLSVSPQRPTIALFFTGVAHAGENLCRVLQQQMEELAPPVQMCDALARNLPKDLETIVAHCLSHARRKFVDLAEVFPQEVQHVLLCLKEVYRTDAAAKRFHLSDELRLQLHQRRSAPLMNELHGWLTEQLERRRVEPNSSLGQAIKYLLNHGALLATRYPLRRVRTDRGGLMPCARLGNTIQATDTHGGTRSAPEHIHPGVHFRETTAPRPDGTLEPPREFTAQRCSRSGYEARVMGLPTTAREFTAQRVFTRPGPMGIQSEGSASGESVSSIAAAGNVPVPCDLPSKFSLIP